MWLLLPVWISGVVLFNYQDKITINKYIARTGWIFSIIFIGLLKYYNFDIYLRELGNDIWIFSDFPLGSADRFLIDYVVCFCVILNFIFPMNSNFSGLLRFEKYIKFISSYTFTLYLTHSLVISIFKHFYDYISNSIFDISLLSFSIIFLTFILGIITDHKRYLFTRLFEVVHHKIIWIFFRRKPE